MATMEELYQQYLLTQPSIGGSQNRYRELMSQMRPFTNPYPAATGLLAGGTVAPVVPKTPAKTSPMGTYGGGGPGLSAGAEMTNSAWDALTDQQKSEFYKNNPGFAKATEIGQAIFSNTLFGRAQALFDPDRVNREGLIRQGFDFNAYQKARDEFREKERQYTREQEALAQAQQQAAENAAAEAAIGSYGGGSFAEQQAINDAIAAQSAGSESAVGSYGGGSFAEQDAINAAIAAREADRNNWAAGIIAQVQADLTQRAAQQAADNAAAEGAIGSYGGGSFAEQQAINDAIAQSISDQNLGGDGGGYGGYSDSAGSSSFGEGQYAKGGKVIKAHLKGPNPKGPDEGYGALLGGEYVIKKSAVKKYGEGLLSMINDGKIPAKKMKSLLG
jgi:hypothetical protein